MNSLKDNSASLKTIGKVFAFLVFVLFLAAPSYAQNTKGDTPEVSSSRQTRFKGKPAKKKKGKPSYNNRISPSRLSPANSARSRKPSSGGRSNVYSQNSNFVHNPSKNPKKVGQQPVSNRATLKRVNKIQGSPDTKTSTKKTRVVPRSASSSFIQHRTINANARFWNVKRKEQAVTTDIAGKPLRTKNFRTPPQKIIEPKTRTFSQRKRIGDRPYTGPSAARYTSTPRTSQKAWSGDIAGRKIRGKNYSSKSAGPGDPSSRYQPARPSTGDRRFKGTMPGGGYKSKSGPGEKRPGKYALPPKVPGMGANGVNYSGRLKRYKPLKGGGSRSGRHWNNKGFAIQPKVPGIGADRVSTFQGNLKSKRPIKGGGSISGRAWNNKRTPVDVRIPPSGAEKAARFPGKIRRFELKPGFENQGEGFTGYTKRGRPVKGGGSRSGKHWNNKGYALQPRIPGKGAEGVSTFQGNIKAGRPLKGGGSVSGKHWNNKGYAIQPRIPGKGAERVGTFQGDVKAIKPKKGGGSISGRLWNNKQTPIPPRTPPASQAEMGRYQGDKMIFEQSPLLENQGEEFTGYIKLPKFRRAYKQNPKANEASALKHRPKKGAYEVDEFNVKVERRKFIANKKTSDEALKKLKPSKVTSDVDNLQVKVERRKYVVNKNSSELALKKLKPTETTEAVDNLQVKVERRKYVINKNSSQLALKKLKPTEATEATGRLQIKVKQYNYIHNSSSAKEALNVREPGKAFVKASDYQGNIKMKKFELAKLFSDRNKNRHPDAQFVITNKNNVKEERSFLTNIKLWWARNFKKNDTQPEHLKEKIRKPRYDRGESGMWNE